MKRRIIIFTLSFLCGFAVVSQWNTSDAHAQTKNGHSDDTLSRVEIYLTVGPMASIFVHERKLPENASQVTMGYNGLLRLKWHPEHLISVGILTGYQQLVRETYTVNNALSDGEITGTLRAVPIMIDISFQKSNIELGVSLGGYILTSILHDVTTAYSSRFELGTVFHGTYFRPLTDRLSLGGEFLVSYMSYRGIVSVTPQVVLKYDLFTY